MKLTQFGELVDKANKGEPYDLYLYYFVGATVRGWDAYTCEKDTFIVSLNPVRGIYWLKKAASLGDNDAIEQLKPYQSLVNDEKRLSFMMSKKDVEETDENIRENLYFVALPYAALAWHYCYGVGCEKNLSEARRLIRLACKDNGIYTYPSYKQLIKDLKLDTELKYKTEKEWLDSNK